MEVAFENGDGADQLESDDIDYLIADLVAIRHHRLPGAEPDDHFHTLVAESIATRRLSVRAVTGHPERVLTLETTCVWMERVKPKKPRFPRPDVVAMRGRRRRPGAPRRRSRRRVSPRSASR